MTKPNLKDIERRMRGAIEALKHEFAGLRTGRASTAILEPITVEVYGAHMPLNQVATISVPEARMLSVQVWDRNNVAAVDKAIRSSGLGLNPQTEGTVLRIPIPELSEERRHELTKVAGKYAEQARIAVRNVRRDGMEEIKRLEKAGELSEDDAHRWSEKVQKMTDDMIHQIDDMLTQKDEEILQV